MIRDGKELNPNGPAKRTEERGGIRQALSIAQPVFVAGAAVFLAGVVAPTLLHGIVHHGDGASSAALHAFHTAGVTFFYTLENLGFAFLGGLCGAIVAWAMAFPDVIGKIRRVRFVSRCRGLATSWAFRGH